MLVATAPTYERRSKDLENIKILENIREKRIESGPKTLGFGPSPLRELANPCSLPGSMEKVSPIGHSRILIHYALSADMSERAFFGQPLSWSSSKF